MNGGCFQERSISSTILHCAETQGLWIWRMWMLCEQSTIPCGLPSHNISRTFDTVDDIVHIEQLKVWHLAAGRYSKRQLTFCKDRFVNTQLETDYIAGLRSVNLKRSLKGSFLFCMQTQMARCAFLILGFAQGSKGMVPTTTKDRLMWAVE